MNLKNDLVCHDFIKIAIIAKSHSVPKVYFIEIKKFTTWPYKKWDWQKEKRGAHEDDHKLFPSKLMQRAFKHFQAHVTI